MRSIGQSVAAPNGLILLPFHSKQCTKWVESSAKCPKCFIIIHIKAKRTCSSHDWRTLASNSHAAVQLTRSRGHSFPSFEILTVIQPTVQSTRVHNTACDATTADV
jgi:hypothetical protein